MTFNIDLHNKDDCIGKLDGRDIYAFPIYKLIKDKQNKENSPSDTATVELSDKSIGKHSKKSNKENSTITPDTTVLGLDNIFDDDSNTEDSSDNVNEESSEKDNKTTIKNGGIKQNLDSASELKNTKSEETKESNRKTHIKNEDTIKKGKEEIDSKKFTSNFVLVRVSTDEVITPVGDNFVVGKSKYSDFQIKGNNTISRSHVILEVKDSGALYIKDNNSKNGTSVNGVYLKDDSLKQLKAGQTIRMSDEEFLVKKA